MSLASGRAVRIVASLVLAIALFAMCDPSTARAVPVTPEISQKQAEATSAQAGLERMRADLEVKVEEYNSMTEAVEETERDIETTRDELERAIAELSVAQNVLGERASAMYKHGGTEFMDVFLGVRSFEDLVSRLDFMRRISVADAASVDRVSAAKALVEETERSLESRYAEQLVLQRQAETRAAAIEGEVSRQQAYVARLDADVRTLVAQEEQRQQALAAARARQAAAAVAAQRAAALRSAPVVPSAGSNGGGGPQPPSTSSPASGDSQSGGVVGIALQYLGVPYVWGGSSPQGFDCSGFVQYVYRQVGVSLPRTSQSQFRVGQHIAADSVDLLQPGDLVFFGTNGDPGRVHHVGMYVGGGDYIHAPYTGAVVRVNSLTARIQSSRDYVGGSRF